MTRESFFHTLRHYRVTSFFGSERPRGPSLYYLLGLRRNLHEGGYGVRIRVATSRPIRPPQG